MPDQKAIEDLLSHVYTIQLRTCLRLGAVSSGLVAFWMLMASSLSDLDTVILVSRRSMTRVRHSSREEMRMRDKLCVADGCHFSPSCDTRRGAS
jgi:hypothetical protein